MAVNISNSASSGGSATVSSGGGSKIEVLQKKLVSLQKELKDLLSAPSKENQAKAQLIQIQIQVTQAELEQLIREKSQRAMESKKATNQIPQVAPRLII
jgi:hypothetical protein